VLSSQTDECADREALSAGNSEIKATWKRPLLEFLIKFPERVLSFLLKY
jgi:hypothetical protein